MSVPNVFGPGYIFRHERYDVNDNLGWESQKRGTELVFHTERRLRVDEHSRELFLCFLYHRGLGDRGGHKLA